MTLHRKIIAASLCSTVLTTPAFAQTESDDAVDTSNVIIVTATRRAEDVQDIPMAVTAVSPVQLERQGVVNVTQLAQVSPSFSSSNAQTSGGTNVFRIRGVGTTSNNIGFESAVGIFIDGAYQSRAGVALSEFVDIERLEVLRGPQGTLFGRNTSAGALNITTRRPDVTEFGGFVNASYGNFDLMSIQGAVNVPVVRDTLALRFTGAYRERDGYVDVVDGTGVIGQSNSLDQFIVRGQLGYEGRGGLNIRLIADYSEVSGNCCNAVELQRSGLETGGIFARVGLGPTGGNFAPSTGLDALDDRISSESFASTSRIEQWGITGEIEFPISNSVDLIYIGSYRDYESRSRTDSDFTSLDIFSTGGAPTSGTRIQTMTHELRLQGEALDGALQWLIGGYYSDEDIDSTVYALLGEDYGEHVGALLFPSTRGAFGANPLTVFSGGIDPAGTSTLNNFTQSSTSWSLFTHNTLEVAEGLEITVGLRYSDESKDGAFQQLNANNAICPAIASNILGAPPAGAFPIPGALAPTLAVLGCFPFTAPADLPAAAFLPLPRTFDDRFSDEELIYTGNISYNIQDLGNIYASFTHGYKSGGFNLDSTAATGGA
ncbi:MAG: TonB-dependent receptor, partial [Parasphingopyxis sp.]